MYTPNQYTRKRTIAPRNDIDNVEFVTVWLSATSTKTVAEHFDVSESVVTSKAYSLRKKGVKLPKMQRKQTEVEKLNKLIEKAGK